MIEQVRRKIVPAKTVKLLVDAMKVEGQTHANDMISILQSTLDTKVRGLRTFVLDVVRSVGAQIGALEVNGNPVPDACGLPSSKQDHVIETRLGRLEAQINNGQGATIMSSNWTFQ
jgi:hypothetical protein